MTCAPPPLSTEVRMVFDAWPSAARAHLLELRALIFSTARHTPDVGALEEALRWGEPAYITSQSNSGSTIRIGWKSTRPDQVAIYFHCRTNLVQRFRTLFWREFDFEGNRAILLGLGKPFDQDALSFCIAASLRYRLDRASRP